MSSRTRIVVPWRSDQGEREALWKHCRAYWQANTPEFDIVEGTSPDGPFNRSAATNDAARGDWDVAIVLDADVLLEPGRLRTAVDEAQRTGAVVLPFTERLSLDRTSTKLRLRVDPAAPLQNTNWTERQRYNVSTCVVVPRARWDEVGGFDERFCGWGGEDDAFHAALRALGPVVRYSGEAWHLWHRPSTFRRDRALHRMAEALSDRYLANAGVDRNKPNLDNIDVDRAGMRRLLDEDRGDDQIVVVCLTNNRRPRELARTLASFDTQVTGPIGRKLIVGDGCAPLHPGWETTTIQGGDYRRAMLQAQWRAIGSGQPWVFWLEDDWIFNRPVDVAAMQAAMDDDRSCVQMSLLRQPWYRPEKQAGGIYETAPGQFRQRAGWVAHRRYWTQNPMLTRRSILAEHPWPQESQSEWAFADLVLADPGRVAGVWGCLDDGPWVHHIGVRRAGNSRGY